MLCQNIFDSVPRVLLETIRPSSLQNLLFKNKLFFQPIKKSIKQNGKSLKSKIIKKNSENNSTYWNNRLAPKMECAEMTFCVILKPWKVPWNWIAFSWSLFFMSRGSFLHQRWNWRPRLRKLFIYYKGTFSLGEMTSNFCREIYLSFRIDICF